MGVGMKIEILVDYSAVQNWSIVVDSENGVRRYRGTERDISEVRKILDHEITYDLKIKREEKA